MSRFSLTVCAGHLAGVAWLGHCATAGARHGAWWTVAAFVAVSALLLTAILRETECADEHVPRPAPPRTREAALADRLAMDWQDFEALCCLRAWESRGTAHDTAHCARTDSDSLA